MEPKKYKYIDCLRGIAIICVVILHAGMQMGTPYFSEAVCKFIDNGKFGVLLFFVVSSYTLMLSLNSRQDDDHLVKNFFIRRFFRIAPLYWLALLYFTFSKIIGIHFFISGHPANPVDWGKFLSNLFFIHGVNPHWINSYVPGGWSIADETTFYLILPFLFTKIKNINTCIIFLFCSVFASMMLKPFVDSWATNEPFYSYLYFPSQFPVFLLGILSYFVVKDGFTKLNNTSLVLICLGIFISCYFEIPYHFIYSLVFFLLIVILNRKTYTLIVNPFLAFIGKISYSIYITHFAVWQILNYFKIYNLVAETSFLTTLFNFTFRFTIMFGLSIPLSMFTYHFIERKFELIGKNYIKKQSKKTAQVTAIS